MTRALAAAVLSVALLGCEASSASNNAPAAISPQPVTPPDAAPAPADPAAQAQPAGQPLPFDSSKAWEHLRQMVAIGPRPSGSEALRQTRAYITRQLAAVGLTVEEQPFVAQTPIGPINMVNLITRIPGKRTDRILITGHYDTKLFKEFVFVGASDGASSAAALIELARVLKTHPHEFTYEFIWFDGEEAVCKGWDDCQSRPGEPDNTYGSRYYVDAVKKANGLGAIKTMILLDMIGAKDLILRKDTDISASWLNDLVWSTAKKLGYGTTFTDQGGGGVGGDDHEPFAKAGIPTIDIINLMDYPQWHTKDDDLNHVAARSLQIVGDVVIAALPEIEKRLVQK